MRKLMNFFAAALVMLAAVGCEKNETLPDSSSKVVTLSATINNGGTKTSLGAFDNGKYPVLWSEGDAIAVVNNGKLFKFVVDSEDAETTQGTFTCTEGEGFDAEQPVQAFYPYEGVTFDGTTISYTVPATQTYQVKSFAQGAMPMAGYAANASGVVSFENLFGVVKLQLKGADGEKLQSVEIVSNGSVSGDAMLSFDGENKPSLEMSATPNVEQAKVVLKKSSEDIVLSDTPTEVLIAIPGATHTFSVYIITDKGAYYKKVSAAQAITAGKIKKMPVLDLTSNTDFPNGKMSYAENGVYIGEGIALPKSASETLIWAPVNCGYDENHKYGLLYQWGRKYGQGYTGETPEPTTVNQQLTFAADGSSEANKDNFYYGNSDWLTPKDDNLWYNNTSGTSTTKTAYDPCPAGWRVPTNAELVSLVNGLTEGRYESGLSSQWTADSNDPNHSGLKGFWFYGNTAETNGNKVFFPAAGHRGYSNGSANARGSEGVYWSSSVNDYYVWYLRFYSNGSVYSLSYYRALGQSVRCVKE